MSIQITNKADSDSNSTATAEIFYSGGTNDNNDDNNDVNFILPEIKNSYVDTSVEDIQKYIVCSDNKPDGDETEGYFLKYTDDNGTKNIKWTQLEKSISGFETNARHVYPNLDFNTIVQSFNLSNGARGTGEDTLSHHIEKIYNYKIEWISLNACVSDIGLRQLTWNTNEGYYNYNSSPNDLKVRTQDENDKFNYKISYLSYGGDYITIKTMTNNDFNDINKKITDSKILSVELVNKSTTTTTNRGPIEFYYSVDTDGDNDPGIENGINEINMYVISKDSENCFNYNCQYQNCQYLNCQYTNSFYNKNIDLLRNRSIGDNSSFIIIKKTGSSNGDEDFTSENMYNLL